MTQPTSTEPRRALTLRDVSEASGVSEMTVSRVLRNRGDVSAATRERVLQASRALGYVPNKIAGALASQRVNLVGVIIPSMSNMVFPEVMTGISSVLDHTGLQPVVGVTNYLPDREEAVLYEMLSWRPSGVIIAGLEHTAAARAMMAQAGIPIVEIMDIDGQAVDSAVGISHRRAGRQMAEAIIASGYRRIAFMGTQMPNDFRAKKRLEGFEEALRRNGLALVELTGRFQTLAGQPTLVLDVAHNPHSVAALFQNLDAMGFYPQTHAVFGAMADKDLVAMMARMTPVVTHWHVCDLPIQRAATAEQLVNLLNGLSGVDSKQIFAHASPTQALAAAQESADPTDRIVV